MYCKNCGQKNDANSEYCSECGFKMEIEIEEKNKKKVIIKNTAEINKKTISYLNSKMWYRLLKVVYIILFLIIALASSASVISEDAPKFDNQMSHIECDDNRILGLDENNFSLHSSYIGSYDDERMRRMCAYNLKNQTNFISDNDLKKLSPSYKNYKLVTIYTQRNWVKTTGAVLVIVSLTLLVFEFLRRIFYYIILGAIKPKK